MKTIKGPGIFLAQFAGDAAPFNSWDAITRWAADCGDRSSRDAMTMPTASEATAMSSA